MTLETSTSGEVASTGTRSNGVPEESFEVEPPYTPDHDALAAVEKYDDRFLDRELSWLHFNQRVLELAEDTSLPLLERVRFLAIFTSNLDEFFMVRVAGLKRRIVAGLAVRAASGLLPREVLESIWHTARDLSERQAQLFTGELIPALSEQGIELVRWDQLTARSNAAARSCSATGSSRC